jgi:hypothetical protein
VEIRRVGEARFRHASIESSIFRVRTPSRSQLQKVPWHSPLPDPSLAGESVDRRKRAEHVVHRVWCRRAEVVRLPIDHVSRSSVPRVNVRDVGHHDDTFALGQPMFRGSGSADCGALEDLEGFRPRAMHVWQECGGTLGTVDLEHPAAARRLPSSLNQDSTSLCNWVRGLESCADHAYPREEERCTRQRFRSGRAYVSLDATFATCSMASSCYTVDRM